MKHNKPIPSPIELMRKLSVETCERILKEANAKSFILIICESEIPCESEETCEGHETATMGYHVGKKQAFDLFHNLSHLDGDDYDDENYNEI